MPYFIASHPGSDLDAMIDLAVFLKRNGYRPDQVQDFIPAPFDVATAMYYTGLDPFTKKPVYIAQHLRDRKLQRALMQFFKPENYFEVRARLEQAGRQDLIGSGCDCLIGDTPPRAAIQRDARTPINASRRLRPSGRGSSETKATSLASRTGAGYRPDRSASASTSKRKPKKRRP